MKNFVRRTVWVGLMAVAGVGAGVVAAQVHATEAPAPKSAPAQGKSAANDVPAPATQGTLGVARAIPLDGMAVRTMANGGESRDIAHGTLATGETVNLHQSMQVVGVAPNAPHVIQHSEFILVREGQLEFQHEVAGQMVSETVGAGGVIYVAFGTRHTVKNVGNVPAKYFVVAIGGDAK